VEPVTNIFPAGSCDTHVHVYDHRWPTSPAATLFPPDATVEQYRAFQETLGLERVVVVQPSTYGLDNTGQIGAAAEIGDAARFVVVVDDTVTDDELVRYTSIGARGARFHMLTGGAVGWPAMPPVAARIAEHGWHVQLQLDGNRLGEHLDIVRHLPCPLVIDHVGRFMPPPGPDSAEFRTLLDLLDTGSCWVKLSAPYESTRDGAPTFPTVTSLVDELVRRFPERLLWASNWPHPGQSDPPTPGHLRDLTERWLPSDRLRRQVLVDNPAILYGFD
jgi:D-galactarolactone isomerase